jgi:hypothetical protein
MAMPEMSTFEKSLYRLYKTYEYTKLKYYPWVRQISFPESTSAI